MAVYCNYKGAIAQRPAASYTLEAVPYVPGYPYQCIVKTSSSVWYLYCSTVKFTYYSSTFTATSVRELRNTGEYVSFRYYLPPTDYDTPSGYWASSYSGPYTNGVVNTGGTKIWSNYQIEDTGLYNDFFLTYKPTYVSGAVDFYVSQPEGAIVLEKGQSTQLGYTLVDDTGKTYTFSNVVYENVPEAQCEVDTSNNITVLSDATATDFTFTVKPVVFSGTTDLSHTVRVYVGPIKHLDPATLINGFSTGMIVRLMRPVDPVIAPPESIGGYDDTYPIEFTMASVANNTMVADTSGAQLVRVSSLTPTEAELSTLTLLVTFDEVVDEYGYFNVASLVDGLYMGMYIAKDNVNYMYPIIVASAPAVYEDVEITETGIYVMYDPENTSKFAIIAPD